MNLTDAEWAVIEPHLPPSCRRGRPREWSLCDVLDAIFYVLRGGIAWRLLPNDLPPSSTAFRWFATWRDSGLFKTTTVLWSWPIASASVARRRRRRSSSTARA